MNVARPEGYQAIIDYWSGKGDRPDPDEAYRTLMQLTEAVKIKSPKLSLMHCLPHKPINP